MSYHRFLYEQFPSPPNLQTPRLGALTCGKTQPASGHTKSQISQLVLILKHPKLNSLSVFGADITCYGLPDLSDQFVYTKPRPDEFATKPSHGVAANIKSLQLYASGIEVYTLIDILNHTKALTSFVCTQSHNSLPGLQRGRDAPLDSTLVKIRDLNSALQKIQDSVETVDITNADRYRWPQETGLLDFGAFTKLRSLRIDTLRSPWVVGCAPGKMEAPSN